MSRVSWRPMPGLERPALVAAPGRDADVCAVVVVLTAGSRAYLGALGHVEDRQGAA